MCLHDDIMHFVRKTTVRKKHTPPICKPDFLARLVKIYGGKCSNVSGVKLVTGERNRH
jgi:hypothetical protein